VRPSAIENLYLRKQPALYRERGIKPRRITHATRLVLVWPAYWAGIAKDFAGSGGGHPVLDGHQFLRTCER
jgi:hypothetical protein